MNSERLSDFFHLIDNDELLKSLNKQTIRRMFNVFTEFESGLKVPVVADQPPQEQSEIHFGDRMQSSAPCSNDDQMDGLVGNYSMNETLIQHQVDQRSQHQLSPQRQGNQQNKVQISNQFQSEDCTNESALENNLRPYCDFGPSNTEPLSNQAIDADVRQESDDSIQGTSNNESSQGSTITYLEQSQQDVFHLPCIQDDVEKVDEQLDRESAESNHEDNDLRHIINIFKSLSKVRRNLFIRLLNVVSDFDFGLDVPDKDSGRIVIEEGCNHQHVVADQQPQEQNVDQMDGSVESSSMNETLIQHQVHQRSQYQLSPQRQGNQQNEVQISNQFQSEDCTNESAMENNLMPYCDFGPSNAEPLSNQAIDVDVRQESDDSIQGTSNDESSQGSTITYLEQSQQIANERKKKHSRKRDDSEDDDTGIAKKFKTSNVKPFQCDICDERFCSKDETAKHIRLQHVKRLAGDSKKTNSFATSRKSSKDHGNNQSVEKLFVCDVCKKSFGYKNVLKRHLMIHNGNKPFKCEVCQMSFRLKQHLVEHSRIHSGTKPYICNVCNKSFRQTSHLTDHLLIHTNEKPHSCKICNKLFRQRGHLVWLVTNCTKPYICNVCNKSFRHRNTLSLHLLIHGNEKPHSCNVCNKSFRHRNTLSLHLLIHGNEKPHSCTICSKSFRLRGTLRQHLKTHDVKQSFSCDYCQKEYFNKLWLERHCQKCYRSRIETSSGSA